MNSDPNVSLAPMHRRYHAMCLYAHVLLCSSKGIAADASYQLEEVASQAGRTFSPSLCPGRRTIKNFRLASCSR